MNESERERVGAWMNNPNTFTSPHQDSVPPNLTFADQLINVFNVHNTYAEYIAGKQYFILLLYSQKLK